VLLLAMAAPRGASLLVRLHWCAVLPLGCAAAEPEDEVDAMPEKTPLMDAAALSKARPLLWLFLVISGLVFAAVAVETLGDVADKLAAGAPASGGSLISSVVIAVVLLGLMAWLIVALLRELAEWHRVIADPEAFVELIGTVIGSRHALRGVPQFLSTSVQLDEPWKGHATVRLLTTNSSNPGSRARLGEIAAVGDRLSIQVYDRNRRRKIAVAVGAGRAAHRTNLVL
jgi:hypothetical protein